MQYRVNAFLPCLTFFAAGRVMTGLLVLLMQATLVLWPAAYSMARQLNESSAIDRILSELAAAYQLPADGVHHPPRKRFRTAEGAGPAPGRAFGGSARRLRPAA